MSVQATPAAPPAPSPLEYRLAFDLASGLLWRERRPGHGALVVASTPGSCTKRCSVLTAR